MANEPDLADALSNEPVYIRYHGVHFELAALRLDEGLWMYEVSGDGFRASHADEPPLFDTRAEALSCGFGVVMEGLDSVLPLVYQLVERLSNGEVVDFEAEGTIGDVAREIVEGMLARGDGTDEEDEDMRRLRAAYEASV